ncbi:cobalt-precorrin-4/precorrin-4 C(11)-methyltransferase [Malaciobacter marinus]|jgi:precorrin-4/cobalt-precorrin-4 C11-methyltransferase|uniref:cobalt-precorrin-4/precorrin-4 C(11)-methyltransferase n=1 Tax=Malaciobacter TaxID=2321114 RepID=UPI0009A6E3DB|nr:MULTISPECIES: cobalt-precorrin-4/precorrin-4 C(11)-methyltransferase [Malaciobacter]RYA22342.1 precorrin-4 C(11)-methyltransferase [Malaciobacter halophilus]SKB40785.1 cobalt-precorrin 4 C11-methyltransferase [Malaciobacter marinus]
MIYFIGAGCGDPDLVTVKAQKILQKADAVLYTGSLVPKEVLSWCKADAIIEDSQGMKYPEIFAFLKKQKDKVVARVHTGDPSIYSTIAKQIEFLQKEKIPYEVIPGITAAFGAAASLGIEYTIPGVSQTMILTRVEGKTPNPESLENILACKNSSLVFYLSILLLEKLKKKALKLGYSKDTPCWVVEKATWKEEQIFKGTISNIQQQVSHIKGVALILLGDFLKQEETQESHLYVKPLVKELKADNEQ